MQLDIKGMTKPHVTSARVTVKPCPSVTTSYCKFTVRRLQAQCWRARQRIVLLEIFMFRFSTSLEAIKRAMSKIRTMKRKVFDTSIYDRNSEDQRRIMDALISKRQPPGRYKTLSQEIKTLRASQMKDGSTEQGNLRRKYECKWTRSKLFPTSLFPPRRHPRCLRKSYPGPVSVG